MDLLGILGIVLVLLVVGAVVFQVMFRGKYRGLHYNWFEFKNEGLELGFDKPEILQLRDLCLANRVPSFNAIYTSAKLVDSCVINQVQRLKEREMPEEQKHEIIERLFMLRNKLDIIHQTRKQAIGGTQRLPANLRLDLTFERIGTYPSQVMDNNPHHFACAMPPEAVNTQEFSFVGKKVKVVFSLSGDAEYELTTRVIDQAMTGGAMGLLHLEHTAKLSRRQKRMWRRIDSNLTVDIFSLKVSGDGGGRKIQIANPVPFHGTIANISAGGVAIKAGGVLKEGSLVKLDFSLDFDNNDSAIARVLSYQPLPNTAEKMLHLKFERITRKTRNRVFEFIYHENRENKTAWAPQTFNGKTGSVVLPATQQGQ